MSARRMGCDPFPGALLMRTNFFITILLLVGLAACGPASVQVKATEIAALAQTQTAAPLTEFPNSINEQPEFGLRL